MQKNKNLVILLLIAGAVILAVYGYTQSWLPLKIGNNSVTPTLEKTAGQEFSVALVIGDKKYQAKIKQGTTVYYLMNNLKAAQILEFSAKEYEGMGALVEEINGIKNDIKANKFWFYYVNGRSANEGISSYILKNNDVIEWKYEISKF